MLFSFFSVSNRDQRGSVHFWRAALGSALQHLGSYLRTPLEFFAAEFPPGCLVLGLVSPLPFPDHFLPCGDFLGSHQNAAICRNLLGSVQAALPPSSSAG